MKSNELSSFGAKLTTSSLSIFKSFIMRLVIFTLFSRMALRKISYSATSLSYAIQFKIQNFQYVCKIEREIRTRKKIIVLPFSSSNTIFAETMYSNKL